MFDVLDATVENMAAEAASAYRSLVAAIVSVANILDREIPRCPYPLGGRRSFERVVVVVAKWRASALCPKAREPVDPWPNVRAEWAASWSLHCWRM